MSESEQTSDSKDLEIILVHRDEDTILEKTACTISQHPNKKQLYSETCAHCDSEVAIEVRSSKSVKNRYLILMLPSLILGIYWIISRAITEGPDTIILSVIIYTLVGIIGYLAVAISIFKSFFAIVKTPNDKSHSVELV